MNAGAIETMSPRPLPGWFPQEAALMAMLAEHQPIYRWRKPSYSVRLLQDLALLLPEGPGRILDIGAGSGLIAQAIARFFPGKTVTAIDVVDRFLPSISIERRTFDGRTLPWEDRSFDCALFGNVLHHVPRPGRAPLLQEAIRVTGGACVVVKDHIADSALDHARLWWLDFVGNAPFGGMVEAHYLASVQWAELFRATGCTAECLSGSRYRTGLAAVAFPNRLEVLFRLQSMRQT
jgi:SAM-dependent methyltransferase